MTDKVQSYWTTRRKIRDRVQKQLLEIRDTDTTFLPSEESPTTTFLPPHVHDCDSHTSNVSLQVPSDESMAIQNEPYANSSDDSFYDAAFGNSCTDELLSSDNNSSEKSDNKTFDDDGGLPEKISDWANKFKIPLNAVSGILNILHTEHPSLPKDARTLLGTKTSFNVKTVAGGQYCHLGIKEGLFKKLDLYPNVTSHTNCVSLQLNIDGLPIFKSSNGQFWPILGMLDQADVKDPFVIGLFYGQKKPTCPSQFFESFVEECIELERDGFVYYDKQYAFCISAVICDAPARAFVKQVKPYNGYYGCDKCRQSGQWNGKIVYLETGAQLRNDSDFSSINTDNDDDDCDGGHQVGQSPFRTLDVGMVSQFPIDYMHQCCLGVVKRILHMMTKGPLKFRLGNYAKSCISESLISLQGFIPREMARKPRGLQDLDRWKATEFRLFLLYTGAVVLRKHVPSAVYDNFLLLSVGMRILLSPNPSPADIDYAEQLLIAFVDHYANIYDKDVVYNVHSMIHLANEARLYGSLNNVSAFPFENYLGRLKKMVRKPNCPLQQVLRRLSEQGGQAKHDGDKRMNIPQRTHNDGPIPLGCICTQYKEIHLDKFFVSTLQGDNCVEVQGDVVQVHNIFAHKGTTYIVFSRFANASDMFSYPCDSTLLEIKCVSKSSGAFETCLISSITKKFVMLPQGNEGNYVVFPLLHTE